MIKTYRSKTSFVISLTLSNGAYRYIKFKPFSRGGATFTTANALEQEALEATKGFGTRFTLTETVLTTEEKAAQNATTKPAETVDEVSEEPAQEKEQTTVEVSDIEEARDYLNEHYGIAKRNMRSTAAVKAMAEQSGIAFVGI